MSPARDFLPQDFRLEQRTEDSTHILSPLGDLDIATAPRLVKAGKSLPEGVGKLVVDLRGVTFLDSSGLRGLLVLRRTAAEGDLTLEIVHDPEVHGPIFRLTRLDEELPLVVADD